MERHQIAYFLAIIILLVFSITTAVTGKIYFSQSVNALIVLLATVLVMYQYSFSAGYILF